MIEIKEINSNILIQINHFSEKIIKTSINTIIIISVEEVIEEMKIDKILTEIIKITKKHIMIEMIDIINFKVMIQKIDRVLFKRRIIIQIGKNQMIIKEIIVIIINRKIRIIKEIIIIINSKNLMIGEIIKKMVGISVSIIGDV